MLLRVLIFGAVFVPTFIAGIAALHFKLPVGTYLAQGVSDASELFYSIREPKAEFGIENIGHALSHPEVQWDRTLAFDGYTLVTLRSSYSVFLIDMLGRVVYKWRLPFALGSGPKAGKHELPSVDPNQPGLVLLPSGRVARIGWARLLKNGDLLVNYNLSRGAVYGAGILRINKDSKLLWHNSNESVHHDMHFEEETGNIITLKHELLQQAPNNSGLPKPILADSVIVFNQDGIKVKEISLIKAFEDTPFEALLYRQNHSPNSHYDRFHTNSVHPLKAALTEAFPMFKPGYLLLSIRNLSALAVIDPASEKAIWISTGVWKGQHSAQFLSNGRILLFDNLGYIWDKTVYSRVLEFDPATNGIPWSYVGSEGAPFFSETYGDVQRLTGGTTLITESKRARIFEVTQAGKIVWDYQLPFEKVNSEQRVDYDFIFPSSQRFGKHELHFLEEVPHPIDVSNEVKFIEKTNLNSSNASNAETSKNIPG